MDPSEVNLVVCPGELPTHKWRFKELEVLDQEGSILDALQIWVALILIFDVENLVKISTDDLGE